MPLRHIAPNPVLMRELQQVSADAEAVLEALGSVNALPDDFPDQEIREFCLSLRDLKHGTDEGCRSQLESARNRIPKWRRMHFHVEDEGEAESDDVVRLYRDMHLDQRLGRLLISAETALDEYRAQVQEHFDDTVVAEEIFSAEGDAGAATAMEKAFDVEASVGAAKGEIDVHLDPANARVDLLKRRLTDAANLARAARSELLGRPIVQRWYMGVVEALQQTPELIVTAGKALRVGADFARPLAKWWAAFKKDPIESVITAIEDLGRALEEVGRRLAKRRSSRSVAPPFQSFRDAPFAPEMVVLPAGSFLMGLSDDEIGRRSEEGPQRQVTVASFAIGRYPVTFAEFDHFCEATGREEPKDRGWGRERMPVFNVSWLDAVTFAVWLSDQTGKTYRLPSEAEWEYACRAGTRMAYWWGDDFDPAMANIRGSRMSRTSEVGRFPANPWGLFDMLGNVLEWVEDHVHSTYEGAPNDGRAWVDPAAADRSRVVRGGRWGMELVSSRCADRTGSDPFNQSDLIGFRVVCSSAL